MDVKAWVEKISIPTYQTGKPEKNPMFLEKRVYQGSSGVVYPHPVIESISNEKISKEYEAVFIENDYLKIMILPELGGRIQRAYDKIKNRDFIYYNQVIKPALVGLAGPWISGGIEFNWPQHHRPSTFSPVDFTIEEFEDGSKTIWVSEIELMFRTKGMAGFTLYKDKAYLEIKGRLFNSTSFPQTFLWWANPAVKVNDDYQSVFPPDVYAVFDHGKRDVSDFPIATGIYYKVNYAPGTDISKYKNIPVPTSYMAIQSQYDFMGCYENDTQAGMLHVADHHVSPGKKQWTWGNGDFGYAWDKQLTDEDGPYIELMTGMFTDNQPDFSWMQPNEIKTFTQYFMPYAEIGYVKNATKEAAINIEWNNNDLQIKVYATSVYDKTAIIVFNDDKEVKRFVANLSPSNIFNKTFTASNKNNEENWKVIVYDENGNELVSYQPKPINKKEIPAAATAAKLPSEIEQVEDLFLNGLHLEQYRHATFNPLDYYDEGLRRSPGDVRCNNAKGLLLLRRGQFAKAEPYFKAAIATLTKRNPNPYDGEPYYNLGLSLVLQEKYLEAYDAFFKATWNDAWQHASFLWLARIAAHQRKTNDALQFAEKSLIKNYHSNATRHLKAALLRQKYLLQECIALCDESIKIDTFNFGCIYEKHLAEKLLYNNETVIANESKQTDSSLNTLFHLMRYAENNFLELALQYAHAGFYEDAIGLLSSYILHLAETKTANKKITPLVHYYLGWLHAKNGNADEALKYYQEAADNNRSIVFPSKIEEIIILQAAIAINVSDAKANYYLGNLWYDKRQYDEAIACWERSIKIDQNFATSYRNLAIAYYNKRNDKQKSLQYLEKAFALDDSDARVLMELDQLYKLSNKPFKERLQLLEKYAHLVEQRDDLYIERITLYNNLKDYTKAKKLLAARHFHPWEGGEGKVTSQYLLCHIELAKQAILDQRFNEALLLLNAARNYPDNLGEGKLFGAQENDLDYLTACAYEGLNQPDKAIELFRRATIGMSEPVQTIYYNDPQPDKIFYQALAWLKLDESAKAKSIFNKFISFGEKHMNDEIQIDYFAVSLPDMLVFDIDLNQRNKQHCNYLIGLGNIGLGSYEKGAAYLELVLKNDINHQGAATYLHMVSFMQQTSHIDQLHKSIQTKFS
jgi:tetratricopeptide (TPR) repeat protein